MQRKGNSIALLVEMETDTAAVENNMKIPLKTGINPPYDPAITLLGIHPEKNHN